jgi:Glycosyl transferase family 2
MSSGELENSCYATGAFTGEFIRKYQRVGIICFGVNQVTIKFSIVIPTFNDLGHLKRSLESIGRQTLPCEVVVVDDGSQDGTEQYVRRLSQKIVYYRNSVPLGYAESANAGVELARGNWILLLNDGDCLQSNCLEQLCQALDRYPKATIAVCQPPHPHKRPAADRMVCVPQEDIHYQMLSDRLSDCQPAPAAFRRDAFLQSGGWRPGSSHVREAIDTWVRIAQSGDAVFVNLPLSNPSDLGLKAGATSLSQNRSGDLELQYQMTEKVSPKYDDWLANSPTVQMIRKFHWNWIGLKNSLFPGVEGVLPGVAIDAGMPASVEKDARVSSQPSFSNTFYRTVSPKPISQLSRI